MAQVLTSARQTAEARELPAGWWPVDLLILAYLLATGALIVAYAGRVPGAFWLLALHLVGALLILWAVRAHPQPQATSYKLQAVFRHWYPLPCVALCYKETAVLIRAIRGAGLDAELARLDFTLWGANPTVWLERFQYPWLTESLEVVYFLFVPAVLLVAALLWQRRSLPAFRYYAFLISLGFLASYVGYFIVPVRGPRFFLAHLQHTGLEGLWLFHPMQQLLDRLESAHYDCFPSGHTELTLLAWWSSRRLSGKLFAAYSAYALAIILATVYLRYHYTVDVFAGAVLAAALLLAAPHMYSATRRVLGTS